MKIFRDSTELKLFMSFLLIYSFFVHISGWNENSRFDLTKAIAEEGRFNIDSYRMNTGDRSFVEGHYYTDKPIGLSIVAVPAYLAVKTASEALPSILVRGIAPDDSVVVLRDSNGNPAVAPKINIAFWESAFMIIATILASSLPSSLNIILLYRLLGDFMEGQRSRLAVSVVYGLGTLGFPYALVFLPYAFGTCLVLIAFSLISKKGAQKKEHLIGGLLTTTAVVFDHLFIITQISFLIYVFFKRKNMAWIFLSACMASHMLFLAFNPVPFNLLSPEFFHIDRDVWGEGYSFYDSLNQNLPFAERAAMLALNAQVAAQILFYPYRGLFFYYPVLVFSIYGLYKMRGAYKPETMLVSSMLVGFIAAISSFLIVWPGGQMFGPRFFAPMMPFLMMPIAWILSKTNWKLFLVLALISIGVNILGLQNFENGISDNGMTVSPRHMFSLLTYTYNPLAEHYLPLTLENGPRSRLFENLLDYDRNVDVRDIPYSKGVLSSPYLRKEYIRLATVPGIGFLVLKTPCLPLVPLCLLLAFIWRNEVGAHLNGKKRLGANMIVCLIAIVVLLISFLSFRDSVLLDGWYSKEKDGWGVFRYMGDKATVGVYNYGDAPEKFSVRIPVWSTKKDRVLELYLNGNMEGRYNATPNGTIIAADPYMRPGENVLTLVSEDGCENPDEVSATGKGRICYSFGVRNMDFLHRDR